MHCEKLKPEVSISINYIAASCLLIIFALGQSERKGQRKYLAEENINLNA